MSLTTMHAETLAADPSAIRWVTPGVRLPSGRLVDAPGPLGAMLADGTLREVTTEPHGVTMRLADGRSWRADGDSVRQALAAGLEDVDQWRVELDEDGTLHRIATDVLAGTVGDYIRSHGGFVTVVDAASGMVDVAFDGACRHCPLSQVTLHSRLETAVRERYPDLDQVRDVAAGQGPRQTSLGLRRRPRA